MPQDAVLLDEQRGLEGELDGRPQHIEIDEMHDLAIEIGAPVAVDHLGQEQAGDQEEVRHAERPGKGDHGVQPALLAGGVLDAERRMHHHHDDDAKPLGVIDPVDALTARRDGWLCHSSPFRLPCCAVYGQRDCVCLYPIKDSAKGGRTMPLSMKFGSHSTHRRGAAGVDGGAARAQRRRAGGAARRRQDHAGAAGAGRTSRGRRGGGSSCWSRGGWRRARRPPAWRRRWARRSGETVGYRVRFGSKVSRATRIEVVTEGVFTRMVLDDPALDGIAAVLFDEFHERSLDADLGLALARDVQQGLREDLRLLVMSATLDGARVAALLGDAPVIESEGRAFPVETRYLGRDAAGADRAAGRRRRARARCAPMPARCWCSCPAPPKSAAPRRCCANASTIPPSTSCRCSARSTPTRRTAPLRRRRPAGARSCWPPRSPKPR